MMKRVPTALVVLAGIVLSAAGAGACGGSTPAPRAPSGGVEDGAAETPAQRCLAIAGAKREPPAGAPDRVTVRHVLVKYAGAKSAAETVSRSREEACLRALEAREKLEGGATFAEVVGAYSEEPGAATREGSIGAIGRTDVVPPFADAAFELGRGDVSHVVETDYGFHVIQRTE
ncbi:MAG: peptidylprolyl isomerase [Labilithrix sp.]|nr:peptidylprolyl isomerase [Labilithrix sp.]